MIVVQLLGGLGNQMFQYAAARRLGLDKEAALKLDLSQLNRPGTRAYRLDRFRIQAGIATATETAPFVGRQPQHRVARAIERAFRPYYRRRVFVEQTKYRFDPHLLDTPDEIYLIGYFQNAAYFKPIDGLLREELALAAPPGPASQAVAAAIDATASVGLHIRRGDYASNPQTKAYHGLLPLAYYHAAIDHVRQRVAAPHFFVFSDDLEWARAHLGLTEAVTWVDANGPETDHEDLWLLSRCQHHIIANSSFSWWGAWLAARPGQIVCAPERWVLDPTVDTSDLLPPAWHRITVNA